MKRAIVVMGVLTAIGCSGSGYTTVEPSSLVEDMLISETSRHAATLKVNVRGEITDHLPSSQVPKPGQGTPSGWYDGGVAYYYRPMLHVVSIEVEAGKETATNVSAHEVCHAKHPHHDLQHWLCSDDLATPTYPKPRVN